MKDNWNASQKGRRVYHLVLDIKVWTTRKHDQADFYITQLWTEYGLFCERKGELLWKVQQV